MPMYNTLHNLYCWSFRVDTLRMTTQFYKKNTMSTCSNHGVESSANSFSHKRYCVPTSTASDFDVFVIGHRIGKSFRSTICVARLLLTRDANLSARTLWGICPSLTVNRRLNSDARFSVWCHCYKTLHAYIRYAAYIVSSNMTLVCFGHDWRRSDFSVVRRSYQ